MSLNTIKKIGPVLELFTPEQPEWRMTDIARALGMPKSSAHSLVTTLAEVGLLSIGPHGRYRLGWNLLSLAERMRSSLDFREHALPVMQDLARALKETVLLAGLDRRDVVYVERVEGTHPMVRLAGVHIGSRVPAHCTAVGKVLLADRDPGEIHALFASAPMKAYTKRTITTFDALQDALVDVRARGHAFDLQEIVPDIACAAVPIRDRHGVTTAAMSVSMPAYRFPQDRTDLLDRMKAAAELVSTRLASDTDRTAGEPDAVGALLAGA